MASAFFYGTLMHPKILKRVIGHDGSYLRTGPALLLEYTRHKINGADYPGIVPYAESRAIFSDELDKGDRCVRGSLVTGLSEEDVRLLDIFEGNEYTRERVRVHPLGPTVGLDDEVVPKSAPGVPAVLPDGVEVETYVWCDGLSRLQTTAWGFDEFVRDSCWKWIGIEGDVEYNEVDRRRDMEGDIVRVY